MIIVPGSPLSVASDAVGSQHTISWQSIRQWRENVPSEDEVPDHIAFYNESGVGYIVAINERSFTLPAGAWTDEGIALRTQDNSAIITAQYVLANAPVSSFFTDYYRPGEKVLKPSLGNSPIGLSAVTLPVTQVLQDGQPSGQTILESTPTGGVQTLLITTDGHFIDRISSAGVSIFDWLGKLAGVNAPVLHMKPSDGTIDWGLYYQTDGNITLFDATNNKVAFEAFHNGGISSPAGPLFNVGGQASAGSFGVPVIVLSTPAAGTVVTATTQQTIFSATLPGGLYEVCASIFINNAGANRAVQCAATFTRDGVAVTMNLFTATSSTAVASFDGVNTWFSTTYYLFPLAFRTTGNNPISLIYQDPNGTPNDTIVAVIKRLA